ncbi:prenyltransferase [Pseudoalteromonas spongiae]|uniref:prenyltransferase n=1 Tax=Pseudoalteromonas spongiae TaxID=298657 RepID=UPI00110A4BBA|nr:prenyltransferase [Pseudoalteromonas spongiae]TMO85445.1 prenyltransferase [Pseudoalteromonas spongiae]
MNKYIAALPAIRPPFLTLAPLSCLVGLAYCAYQGITIDIFNALLSVLGAILAAIAVNTINEYQDFQSGLDLNTTPTPFSGGSGLLKQNPALAPIVKWYAVGSVIAVILIGVFFIFRIGTALVPIGLLGLLIVVSYTKVLNKHPWLCFIAPGIGFAILMPVGAFLVQTGNISYSLVAISLVPFLITNNLLLINQLPDIVADKSVGRKHIAIYYGVNVAHWVFALSLISAFAGLVCLVMIGLLPKLALIALLPLVLCLLSLVYLFRLGDNIAQHLPAMGMVAAAANLTPLMLSLALFMSKS